MPETLLKYKDVARRLAICERSVYNLADEGTLTRIRLRGAVRFSEAEVEALRRTGAANSRTLAK